MKLVFSKREKMILGFFILFIILLISYVQFFILSPLKSDISVKEKDLTIEQRLLEVIGNKHSAVAKQSVETTKELQKSLPVEPMQGQFILDLEKAETFSNSKISSMSFSKDMDANSKQQTDGTLTSSKQGTTSQEANSEAASPQINGLKKLSVSLSVESPTYEDFEKFIETLESSKRIIVVDSISYTGSQEITSLEQVSQPLNYSLTISAFYMPTLTDLVKDLPKMKAPVPAGKQNPLSQFSDMNKP